MQPGTRLDQYEITGKLGEGGMGAVYRAEDTRLKREVAIKVLPPELAADAERLARLEREAQLLASLNHPNLATVHGFGDVQTEVDGAPQRVTFLVMELVSGESLHARVAAGPIPWAEAVRIGIGVASGLEAAHERGIVHRDLKPANVQVADDGTVKVLDFGLAKAYEGDGVSGTLELSASPTAAAATQTGVIMGTAAYMSPEQARGKAVDKRADVWALGCLLYELLAGHKAFEGETVSDILAAILKEEPNFDALPAIPPTLRHVLERCLAKQPAQRMRDVGDVRIELEAALTEEPRAAARERTRGLSLPLAAGMILAAAVLGAVTATYLRPTEPPKPESRVLLSPDAIAEGPAPLAISPDGRWVAEAGFGRGLRLRAMNSHEWRTIPGTEEAGSVTFSADSELIYLAVGEADGSASLYQMALDGTSPILVAEVGTGFPTVFRGRAGGILVSLIPGGPGFSIYQLQPNGSLVEAHSGTGNNATVLVTTQIDEQRWLGSEMAGQNSVRGIGLIDGRNDRVISILPGYRSPLYLGDGRLLATDAEGRMAVARINVDDGTVIEPPAVRLEGLALAFNVAAGYSFSDAGTFVYLAGDVNAAHEEFLSWLDHEGNIEPFSTRGIEYQVDTFPSPDGTRVAAEFITEEGTNNVTIHVHDIARDISAPLVPGTNSSFPVWAPDSARIAYYLLDESAPGIYSAPIDRSELPTLLLAKPDDAHVLPLDWSPDGSTILYVRSGDRFRSANTELNDLWLLPVDGGEPRALIAGAAREVDGRFSPDGRWVAYQSDLSGSNEIYIRALEGGGEYQISATGGTEPEWSPDGEELYFLRGGEIRVVDVDLDGATPEVSQERLLVSMQGPEFKQNLYAPWPDGDRFLVATHAQLRETRTLRAIFDWNLLRQE